MPYRQTPVCDSVDLRPADASHASTLIPSGRQCHRMHLALDCRASDVDIIEKLHEEKRSTFVFTRS
jgi:hypothetical protein